MQHHCKTRTANILLTAAGAAFAVAGALGLVDGRVSGRAFAATVVGLILATVAVVVNTRQVAGGLAVAVARAPREQYWRGYKDRGDDSAPGADIEP
ncbi:hypothetical protein O7602_26550 [Micromonospora sp. WMMD1128]|uniref:hypothetical protein n=1 Tax=Micromonospora sp. WMMD1128 TaxID=3015150 RepID=UPI00248CC058|nr:hypothetical protein [Micromonospora sp. WMMD1128]WBB73204.1 hypothetical protein O7602_26550 [Micromonospora sp. WMMD1128]